MDFVHAQLAHCRDSLLISCDALDMVRAHIAVALTHVQILGAESARPELPTALQCLLAAEEHRDTVAQALRLAADHIDAYISST